MSAKSTLVIAGVALCVGFSLNSCSDPVPETKLVTVPTVKVVTKTVEVKGDTTHTPLPQSCLDALATVEAVNSPDREISRAVGEILVATSDVELNAVQRDVEAMNKHITTVRQSRSKLSSALIGSAEARLRLKTSAEICQRDLAKQ